MIRSLGIATVRDRFYRGPCLTVDELEPYLAPIRAKKADALALIDVPCSGTVPISAQYIG